MTPGKLALIPDTIEHIVSAIGQNEKYSSGLHHKSFKESDMARDAVIIPTRQTNDSW